MPRVAWVIAARGTLAATTPLARPRCSGANVSDVAFTTRAKPPVSAVPADQAASLAILRFWIALYRLCKVTPAFSRVLGARTSASVWSREAPLVATTTVDVPRMAPAAHQDSGQARVTAVVCDQAPGKIRDRSRRSSLTPAICTAAARCDRRGAARCRTVRTGRYATLKPVNRCARRCDQTRTGRRWRPAGATLCRATKRADASRAMSGGWERVAR